MNEKIIENFLSLCAIPHKSHHEEKISRFLYDWAVKKGLAAVRDEEGNVIIDKAGSAGHENAPRTILQAHMDMVVVWEDGMDFDPLNDTITVINDGKTLKAKGTSLGGDDGAGVALAMSILEDETAVHGPIRAIFTVDEEDGMSGADHLDPKHLDAKYLINLDWEEFGSLCNSSAGSDMYRMHRAAEWEAASGKAYKIAVSGLVGGHSGASIHLKLANAIRIAARTAKTALDMCPGARLAAFRGGSAHNAIPASCTAVITVPEKDAEKVLDNMCRNKTFGEICEMKPEMEDSFMGYKNIFVNVIEALKTYVQTTGDDVVTAGEDKILDHPEYDDIGKIKDFLSVVTSKDKVMTLLSGDNRDIKINVKIGADGYDEIPKECSLVTATYSANGNKLGTYGVIGPIRMDYQKVVAVLENVGKILESILTNR